MGNELRQAELIADARPRVIGALAGQFRDLELAEEAFSASVEKLLGESQEVRDVAGWLYVTARRQALDIMRRRAAEQRAISASVLERDVADIIELPDPIPDERLRLIFICCHPALSLEARAALTLRIVCGVPVENIASAFLVKEASMYQRLTRSKEKIRKAGVPFETPGRRQWDERLDAVLLAMELAATVAYRDSAGGQVDLADEVERLLRMLCDLLPQSAEVLGLHALALLIGSRRNARVDSDGVMVPLSKQDCSKWDIGCIEKARQRLDQAAEFGQTGPYQIMASIHLGHAIRKYDRPVDWAGIVRLYDALATLRPTSVTAINRAVAIGYAESASSGLAALAELDEEKLAGFIPFHAAKARLSEDAGKRHDARAAYETALSLYPEPAERLYLERRLELLSQSQRFRSHKIDQSPLTSRLARRKPALR